MNKNKITYVALSAVTLAVLGGGLYANTASAHFGGSNYEVLVKKFTEKFDLEESEVKEFFAEIKEEHSDNVKEKYEARLDQAVEKGNITEEQKQLILNKRADLMEEFKTNKDTYKDLPPEQRKELHEAKKSSIEQWSQQTGIDTKYLHPHKGHKNSHFKGKRGFKDANKNRVAPEA